MRLGVVGRGGLVVWWSGLVVWWSGGLVRRWDGTNVGKCDDPHLGPGCHHVLLHRVARLAGVPVRLAVKTDTVATRRALALALHQLTVAARGLKV
jgi:hypothetical protein